MGIFARLGSLIKSNLNDLINKAEDPEKMLAQVMLDMQSQLVDAKKAVAAAIADEKKLQKQVAAEVDKSKEWERKAMLAVRSGDDNLARQALARKQEHDTLAAQFEGQWQQQKAAVDKLKEALRMLSNKIEEAKRKRNLLVARQKRAEAQNQIANTMQGLGDNSAFDTFERMADRVALMEAQAEAGAELAGELSDGSLESKFAALEAGAGADDDALARLKAKMALGSGSSGADAKQLGAGGVPDTSANATSGANASGPAANTSAKGASPAAGSLSAEDMKELEDLNLDELEKEMKKA